MPTIPDFRDARWQESRSDAQLQAGIMDGRGKDMPAFTGVLSREEARLLTSYIRAFCPSLESNGDSSGGDFRRRLEELQRQFNDLNRQMQSLSRSANAP